MPPGVPVAAVAINGAKNAGLLAAAILALKHADVRESLLRFRREQSA
jgi:5-(carboxyamino)imidazole ribonucleotide mutase